MKKMLPDGDGITNEIGGGNSNIGAGRTDPTSTITAADPSWGPGI
ncbi:MAG: hypothetical protein WC790_00750 [Candidatus Paceibacterota bacterium]|jgi:hypothetical protein